MPPNSSFKPNLLRSGPGVANGACHAGACTAQVGLTQALAPMINFFALLFLIGAAIPQDKPDASVDELLCGEATGIFLPEPQGTPAPNIQLKNFQYMSPGDRCGRNVATEELMRLHSEIKLIAAKAFGDSPHQFSVMVRYTLTPNEPAEFDMQVMDATESDRSRLTAFYNHASALKDFHSPNLVYVVFHYAVSPAAPVASKLGG